MAWVKIDDQISRHEKIAQVPMAASWLWVCCIAHCQSQLTDGYISKNAMSIIVGTAGAPDIARARANGHPVEDVYAFIYGLADDLLKAGLLDPGENAGYMVHDYLDNNPSKESVLRKRREDARRKALGVNHSARSPRGVRAESERSQRAESERSPNGPSRAPASHPIPSHPISNSNNEQVPPAVADTTVAAAAAAPNGNGNGHGRKRRPQFENERFAVHHWQVQELISMLGQAANGFDLDEWLMTGCVACAKRETAVVPDWWKWLKVETVREAGRRGLPLASPELPEPPHRSKQTRLRDDILSKMKG